MLFLFTACHTNEPTISTPDDNNEQNKDTSTVVVKPKYISKMLTTYTYMNETLSSIYPNGYNYEVTYQRGQEAKFLKQTNTNFNGILTCHKYTNVGNTDYGISYDSSDQIIGYDTVVWADNDRIYQKETRTSSSKVVYERDPQNPAKVLEVKHYSDNHLYSHTIYTYSGNKAYLRGNDYDIYTQEIRSYNLDTIVYYDTNSLKIQHCSAWNYKKDGQINYHYEYDYTFFSNGLAQSYIYLHYDSDSNNQLVLSRKTETQYTWSNDELHCRMVSTEYSKNEKQSVSITENDFIR